ncbi:hypothetical protein DPX16_22018 [Anabarilius grahami]|uniref:Uncharacterized protein n=1 Tax=Anabarilius grahami TaxID=495550 RepID=A0A3N0XN55_ANAGA|nr:hypothetical protein DPX16_22018 [Anabarilius grahami]
METNLKVKDWLKQQVGLKEMDWLNENNWVKVKDWLKQQVGLQKEVWWQEKKLKDRLKRQCVAEALLKLPIEVTAMTNTEKIADMDEATVDMDEATADMDEATADMGEATDTTVMAVTEGRYDGKCQLFITK